MAELGAPIGINKAGGAAAKSATHSDSRFQTILEGARQTKQLLVKLNEVTHHKLGDLLGNYPRTDSGKIAESPECWADQVIYEQNIALAVLRDTLDRMESM
ncbi:MAG: hypothetical protein OEV91_10795 [Desulfobulbaceae bacterium]|nr:hypothetical protein [Desulfobulbaceae bacterium]